MTASEPIVLSTRGLSKCYGGVDVLKGIDLTVRKYSIFGFLGPNGAGKSTTIKLLLGLARPSSGSGSIFGHDIVNESLDIRKRIGYLAQDPRFYDPMTARETLRFIAGFFYRGPKAAIEARIDETLELVGLQDKADRAIKGFSGGERQRLGIAQAQINHPDLLILDEPAASLDPMGRRDVLEVMARLRKHTTIFFSTHILEDVERVGDTVAILSHGRLVKQAPISEVLQGKGAMGYTLYLKGDLEAAYARLTRAPWVQAVEAERSNGASAWHVSVSDQAVAEAQLLPLVLADGGVTVVDFRRKQVNLEEAFMDIIQGGAHGQ